MRSLVSHILLSTSPKSSMNLGLQQLPCDPIACWRLRCLLCYLHSLLQVASTAPIQSHPCILIIVYSACHLHFHLQLTAPSHLLTFTKEVLTREGEEEVSRWQDSDLPLIPLLLVEEEDGTSAQQLRLLSSPALSSTSPVHNAAVLRQPEVLVPLMLVGDSLGPKESLRVSGLSFIPTLHLPSTSNDSLVDTLGSLLSGLQPSSAHNVVRKSELRRPSVDAVTSAATSSSAPLTLSSEPFSLSDSCADNNNNSDSELSYNVSEGGVSRSDRKQKVTKKKETFSERLKAALARGNTPDESDDASAAAPVPLALRRVKVPMNQRAVRRQVDFRQFLVKLTLCVRGLQGSQVVE